MEHKRIAVIGIGEFGALLVRRLYEAGHEVLAIDRDMDRIEGIAPHCTHAVCLDSTDERALRDQELEDMDTLIVAMTNFESLITTADILRAMKVRQIMARYQTGLEFKILRMLGISELFNPGEKAARNMVEQFAHSGFHNSIVVEGEFTIVEVITPKSLIGLELGECGLREKYHLNLVTIKRDTAEGTAQEILGVPNGETRIAAHDTLVIFGRQGDIEIFLEDGGD